MDYRKSGIFPRKGGERKTKILGLRVKKSGKNPDLQRLIKGSSEIIIKRIAGRTILVLTYETARTIDSLDGIYTYNSRGI